MPDLIQLLEYWGGERDSPPPGSPPVLSSALLRGLIWVLLLAIVYAFSGQSSRFLYIDF
jgi:hypothetical protein